MRFKNYIWDFDGTLFNTYIHELTVIWNLMEKHGIDSMNDPDRVYRLMRVGYSEIMKLPGMTEDIYYEFRGRGLKTGNEELFPKILPFADSYRILAAIVSSGGKNYLYTHRDSSSLSWYLREYGFDSFFSDAVTADEIFPAKPCPDGLLELCRRNSIDPSVSIMIGDRYIDGMAGKNAGMAGALVNYPPELPDLSSPSPDALRRGIDYTAESLAEFARQMEIDMSFMNIMKKKDQKNRD